MVGIELLKCRECSSLTLLLLQAPRSRQTPENDSFTECSSQLSSTREQHTRAAQALLGGGEVLALLLLYRTTWSIMFAASELLLGLSFA